MANWTWRYEDEHAEPVVGPDVASFDNQSDAESWLGEAWQELAGAGVHQVVLLEDDTVVYGPMGLHPA